MTRIKLWIGETWAEQDARLHEAVRRAEAGEITEDCDQDFGFVSWEHFTSVLGEDAPELAAELLTMPEPDRFSLFDTPAGQEVLQRLLARFDWDTSCPG